MMNRDVILEVNHGWGWFQLSNACNQNAPGKSIAFNFLNNPHLVDHGDDVAATTRIVSGPEECDGGGSAVSQETRVNTCKRIELCFGLEQATKSPLCQQILCFSSVQVFLK